MKNKRQKYAVGTSINNLIEDPSTALAKHNIQMDKAEYEAASNPLLNIMKGIGNTAMQVGGQLVSANAGAIGGKLGIDPNIVKQVPGLVTGGVSLSQTFATGGKVNFITKKGSKKKYATGGIVPVEVEGDEVAETPDGNIFQFSGPSHEKGGIDANLPEGTEIYSKRVMVDGKTMAQRKSARERLENKFKKRSEGGDEIYANTLKKVQANNQKEEEFDRNIQQAVHDTIGSEGLIGREKHATKPVVGRFAPDLSIPDLENPVTPYDLHSEAVDFLTEKNVYPTEEMQTLVNDSQADSIATLEGLKEPGAKIDLKGLPQITGGDIMNMAGNIFSGVAPYLNTLKQRSTDTPNINAFKNYGQKAIDKMSQTEGFARQNMDEALKTAEENRLATTKNNRRTARGVNTMRALDLAAQEQYDNQAESIYSNYANQMQNILSKEAQLENDRDAHVMQGEQARDLADRQDKDAFYKAKGEGLRNLGNTFANTGKQINQIQQRDVTYGLLGSKDFGYDPSSGKVYGLAAQSLNLNPGDIVYPDRVKQAWDSGSLFNPETGLPFNSLEEAQAYYSSHMSTTRPDNLIRTTTKTTK